MPAPSGRRRIVYAPARISSALPPSVADYSRETSLEGDNERKAAEEREYSNDPLKGKDAPGAEVLSRFSQL